MKKTLVSVVVPVYNTEKYIEKCLNSLVNQTLKDIEILVIDDGSTDNSKKIIESFRKYKQVKVFYNGENKGVAYSKSLGVNNSCGKYIGFVDSDDYIPNDYYEKMVKVLEDNNGSLALCDVLLLYENSSEKKLIKCYNGNKVTKESIVNTGLAAACCNKLFRADIIKKYQFPIGKNNEDLAITIPSVLDSDKIFYIEDIQYYYLQRKNSIQNAKFNYKKFDIIDAVDNTLEIIKDYKNYDQVRDSIIFNQIILFLLYVIAKEKGLFHVYKIIKEYYRRTEKYEIENNRELATFLSSVSKKRQIFYKSLIKNVSEGRLLLASLLIISTGFFVKIFKRKNVIKKRITIDTLEKVARRQERKKDEKMSISVIIPNYNYANYLYERVYSILNQTYKIKELIILDDASTDESETLIKELQSKLKKYITVKTDFNEINSKIPFKQWQKGFKMASGNYVWIAEADDYCKKGLLKELVSNLSVNTVISYSNTAFINSDGRIRIKDVRPQIDLMNTGHWKKKYINTGRDEIENYAFLNCTIPNVSACIIKNNDYSKLLDESCEYRQAGDWVFYLNLMQMGDVSFSNKTLNFYRVHGGNVSSLMKNKEHIDEIIKIHNKVKKENNISSEKKKEMVKRIQDLRNIWGI